MPKPTPPKPSRKPSSRTTQKSVKKPASKRTRKRPSPQKNPPKPKNRFVQSVVFLVVAAGLVVLGYWLGRPSASEVNATHASAPIVTPPPAQKPSPKGTIHVTQAPKPSQTLPTAMEILQYGFDEDALGEEEMPEISWYEPGSQKHPSAPAPQEKAPTPVTVSPVSSAALPRLVIIIDDISHPRQLKTLKSLPYHITPSIFPPSELSASSHKLARGLKHYMVHLPLQSASRAMNKMQGMLFVKDTRSKVKARVEEIRRLFPKAKYINNHTGSVFTSDTKAMKRLYGLLRASGFVFVDSRTTAKSKVRSIAKSYGDPYIARDIFIDNTQTRSYVLAQLKKAVRIAKKRGFAIAIGHPHKATMDALRHAGSIFKGIQIVYMDELYR